jgi:hypothetical protein
VRAALAAGRVGQAASFAGRSLAGLDLKDLDFSGVLPTRIFRAPI